MILMVLVRHWLKHQPRWNVQRWPLCDSPRRNVQQVCHWQHRSILQLPLPQCASPRSNYRNMSHTIIVNDTRAMWSSGSNYCVRNGYNSREYLPWEWVMFISEYCQVQWLMRSWHLSPLFDDVLEYNTWRLAAFKCQPQNSFEDV